MDPSLTDFSLDLNVPAFDAVVSAFYRSTGPQVCPMHFWCHLALLTLRMAMQQLAAKDILERFQEAPDAWKRVDTILENSSMAESKVRPLLPRPVTIN
jgi:hypothetical protein